MKNAIYAIIKCMVGAVWLAFAGVVSGQAPAKQTSLTSLTTPQQPGTLIDGPAGLCPGAIQEYCVPEVAGAKYHWSISGDAWAKAELAHMGECYKSLYHLRRRGIEEHGVVRIGQYGRAHPTCTIRATSVGKASSRDQRVPPRRNSTVAASHRTMP